MSQPNNIQYAPSLPVQPQNIHLQITNNPPVNNHSTQDIPQSSIGDDFPVNRNTPNYKSKQESSSPSPKRMSYAKSQSMINSLKYLSVCCNGRCWGILGVFIYIVSALSILGILIALMVYHFGRDTSMSSMGGALSYIAYNSQANPIINIELANSNCPSGTERLYLGNWPGTVAGCDCFSGEPSIGFCDENHTHCNDIRALESYDLVLWDNEVFCATRVPIGDNYVKKKSCPLGFKKCWEGNCIKENLDCPITNIILSDAVVNSNSKPYGTKYYTLFRNEDNKQTPGLIDVRISNNDIPCFSQNEMPYGIKPYNLLDEKEEGCKAYGVDRKYSFGIQIMKQEQVLRDNKLPAEVFSLPEYLPKLRITNTLLSGRRKIDINPVDACLNFEFGNVNEVAGELIYMERVVTVISILTMVLHCAPLLVILIVVACSGKKNAFYAYYVTLGLEVICFIVMVSLVSNSTSILEKNLKDVKALNELNCFAEGPAKQAISDVYALILGQGLKRYSLALVITSSASLVMLIVSTFFANK